MAFWNYLICAVVLSIAARAFSIEPAMDQPYRIGTYLYTDRFEAAAAEQDRDVFDVFDEHLAKLAAVGVNVIHVTIVDPAVFDRYVALAEKHQIKLLPELDFAYFRLHWTEEEMVENAKKATDFLKQWHATPQVLAWSIKEEPYFDDVEKLDRYYRMIVKEVPEVKFFMVASGGGWLAANAADLPFALVGGDYYYFSWEQGPADKASARWPDQALKESRETTAIYRRSAEKFNVPRIHVFSAAASTIPDRAQGLATGSLLPQDWTPEQKDTYVGKVKSLAEQGRDGWNVYNNVPGLDGPQYSLWTLYMPPTNCIRALAWGSIMEGANVTMCFMYNPHSKKYYSESPLDAVMTYRAERYYVDLGGRPDRPNPHFDEFADTVRQVRAYDNILSKLTILSQSPLEHISGDNIYVRAFSMREVDGTVLIVHNANVGHILCPECESQSLESCRHVFINDHGELRYFKAKTTPDKAELQFPPMNARTRVFDIASGQALDRIGRSWSIEIDPGGAKLLYIGDTDSARMVHSLYKPIASGS